MKSRRKVPPLRVVETSDGDPTGEARPIVRIEAGRRSEAIDRIEAVFVERGVELFQRGDALVRVAPQEVDIGDGNQATILRIVPTNVETLRELCTRHVKLVKFDRRANADVAIDCPVDLAKAWIARIGDWRLPSLRAVATAPCPRPDGSLIVKPGLDARTGIFFDPCGVEFPPVPAAPSKDDAAVALKLIETQFGTFDFVDDISRSACIAGLLQVIYRTALSSAPACGVDATVAGTGKTKLVHTISTAATGAPSPVIALG